MTFEQMQQLFKSMLDTQTRQNQLLQLHGEMISRMVFGLDAFSAKMQESELRHDKEIAEIRLILHEATDKLDALIKVVDGIVGGKQ